MPYLYRKPAAMVDNKSNMLLQVELYSDDHVLGVQKKYYRKISDSTSNDAYRTTIV